MMMEADKTITAVLPNSFLVGHVTLWTSSSYDSLQYVAIFLNIIFLILHGKRGSNSRHLVLETSALPTELFPYVLTLKQSMPKGELCCFFIFV